MNTENNRYIDELIGNVLEDNVPADVDRRLRSQLESFRSRLGEMEKSTVHRSIGIGRRVWLGASAAAAAATIVVAVFWSYPAKSVLADVFKAVAKQAWMHAKGKGPNDTDIEMWYAARDGVIAMRQGRDVMYANVPQDTIEVYEHTKEGTSYLARLPIEHEQKIRFASQEQTLQALFFGNPVNAVSHGPHEIASCTKKTVQVGDATFTEYHLTSEVVGDAKPMVTVLRVDPKTQLPVSWKSMIGDTQLFSCQVEYLAHGPQSVYAMGVPRGVKVVNQTPSDDLKHILAAWKAGRTRFDSYRAVVVESPFADHRAGGYGVYQVWRKGLKWRIEQLREPPDMGPRNAIVPADADSKMWWLACGQKWQKMPEVVSDGKVEIRLKYIRAEPIQEDPANRKYILIKSMEPERTNTFAASTDDPRPGEIGLMPEFEVYPTLSGRGGWHFETTAIPHPTGGPQGTVLVENIDRNPSKLPGRFRGERYWADPACGYVVRQVQWLKTGEADNSMQGLVEMQQFALSPSGLWYPLVVRHVKNAHNSDTGKISDTYYRYYLDFEAEIPDTLFDVHEWGPIK